MCYHVVMVSIREGHFDYQFKKETMVSVRKKMGLSQAKLADQLGVPVNTVSRWETGTNTPDAHALAAIYSLAKSQGMSPQFFVRRPDAKAVQKQRTKLVVAWDFQNRALKAEDVRDEWEYMWKYIGLLFPVARSSRLLVTYVTPNQWEARDQLEQLGFRVEESYFDADSQLIQDSLTECEKRPKKTVFILATNDGNYAEFLRELRDIGVDVYLWATDEASERLTRAVPTDHFIHWDAPFVVVECVSVIKKMKEQPIGRGEFGAMCKKALDEYEYFPEDVGFSRRNPYRSLLRWMETHGVVDVVPAGGKANKVSIKFKG